MDHLKNIHIGEIIKIKVKEEKTDLDKIQKYFKCSEEEIFNMFQEKSLDSDLLLKWSKILKYDFFRLYTQHLILYSPPKSSDSTINSKTLPNFRKNIYTREVIGFILEMLSTGNKTKQDIIEEYGIPKSTLHKWMSKYRSNHS